MINQFSPACLCCGLQIRVTLFQLFLSIHDCCQLLNAYLTYFAAQLKTAGNSLEVHFAKSTFG